MITRFAILLVLFSLVAAQSRADYAKWQHSGSVFLLTTPDGAAIDASATVEGFPVLVRLHRDFFDFAQAKANGDDLRFSTAAGEVLPYQIEEWDAANGIASVWVRIPAIRGNQRQELRLHWGNADAASESNGSAVFNASNGYLSVWHMSGPVKDDVGTLESKDNGTTQTPGVIGQARHLAGKQGIFCGDKIIDYPSGASSHSTEAWFRIEKPNATIIGWGNEGGGRGSKIRMQFRSPAHIKIDSDFSDVRSEGGLKLGEWTHVVHTYDRNHGKIYLNGQLAGEAKPTLAIKSPARLWIGGWYNNYDFVGDIDEVRTSTVARSADWVKLEYENQKPQQTLVGPIVRPGDAFAATPRELTVDEGQSAAVDLEAGGAQKIIWILKRDGKESVVATDRLHFKFDAGRVVGDMQASLLVKAIYPAGIRTLEIPVRIRETIPEPDFTLVAPATWDGRSSIEIVPKVNNLPALQSAGGGAVKFSWSLADLAVTHVDEPGKLILTRAQNSGTLNVAATASNGGAVITRTATIQVTEPPTDAWVARRPGKDEKPVDHQFYPRNENDEGTLHYAGVLGEQGTVGLQIYADGKPYHDQTLETDKRGAYEFAVQLKAGLVRYKAELFRMRDGQRRVLESADDLVCGDAYLIDGQSNAEAVAWGKDEYPFTSPWIRSFGSPSSDPKEARTAQWFDATARAKAGRGQIGYWGMELGRRLVESQKMPICIVNGAVGGTRIDQHQRGLANPEDVETIYGRLLWRVRRAGLTHGIRAFLWHQGENDQGADGPSGGFGFETYRALFLEMAAGWKQDYPNVQHYYVFQIWPKSCAMGIDGSDNRLREVQRLLPTAFSRLEVMSTLGIDPPGGCHYPPAGYAEFARLIAPLLERDLYAKRFPMPVSAPNLRQASFTTDKNDAITLEFDQPVKWEPPLLGEFELDGVRGKIASGVASGNQLILHLTEPTTAKTITYLDSKLWSQSRLLRGENGIAALTFCERPIRGK